MKRIEQEWESYRRRIIPFGASTTQIVETRRAFYGGVASLMGLLLKQLDPGEEPTEKDLKMMDELQAELEEFLEEVKAGRG